MSCKKLFKSATIAIVAVLFIFTQCENSVCASINSVISRLLESALPTLAVAALIQYLFFNDTK